MGVRHDLYVQREECRVGGLDNVGGVRHNVVLDEGAEGSGKESKSHDIMLLSHLLLLTSYFVSTLSCCCKDLMVLQHSTTSEHFMLTKRPVAGI